jgi:hypothetical protein
MWSMNYSFSMPYPGWPKEQAVWSIRKELSLLDSIDKSVQNMLTYPEAESILNKIKEANND